MECSLILRLRGLLQYILHFFSYFFYVFFGPQTILFHNAAFPSDFNVVLNHKVSVNQDKQGRDSYVIGCCFGLNESQPITCLDLPW